MVDDASGCCASALSAEATALPSPMAGIMQPMLVAKPAVAIDVTAIIVMLSIVVRCVGLWFQLTGTDSRLLVAAAM